MYTQCPECSTAFRVTADVLKQAAGKVRCGGCGNAFNALEYLSESMPERQPAKPAEEDLPELKPEPPPNDGAPVSISAEQSAALLKTLDELAGSDIRIEDTTYPEGSYVIRMDQPYSRAADMLLDRQYFNVDDARPYDDVGWSLGPNYNLRTDRVEDVAVLERERSPAPPG